MVLMEENFKVKIHFDIMIGCLDENVNIGKFCFSLLRNRCLITFVFVLFISFKALIPPGRLSLAFTNIPPYFIGYSSYIYLI